MKTQSMHFPSINLTYTPTAYPYVWKGTDKTYILTYYHYADYLGVSGPFGTLTEALEARPSFIKQNNLA